MGFTIVFVNETIELVELSVPLSFGGSCLLSLFSSCEFSIKLSLFIILCLFFLHVVFILSHLSMMVFVTMVFHFQKFVDPTNLKAITFVPARAIVFVDKSIKWVVLSSEFSFLKSFLCCGSFVSSINCNSTIDGVRLSLVCSKLILF